MSRNEIYHSLNRVFELMIRNKLSEDMDDTLLEKLLSVIKLKIPEDCSDYNGSKEKLSIVQDLLLNTQVLHLAEKVMISLNGRTSELSPSIQKFTIELIGVMFGNQNVFVLYKDSIVLRELAGALRENVTAYLPTVQSAFLLCCTNIAKHFEGIKWLKEQNLLQFVFSSFSSSSYHVRAKAVSFFTEVLSMWTPSNMSLLPTQEKLLLSNIFENVVLNVISEIQFDGMNLENNTTDCCLLILKNSFEVINVRKLVKNSSVLKQQLSHYFDCLKKSDTVNKDVLNLLLCLYTSGGVSELFVQDISKILTSHLLLSSAIDLVGSILRHSKQETLVSKHHIQLLTLPLKILAGISFQKDVDLFGLSCPEIYDSVTKSIENKSDCIKIIISCLLSLSKLSGLMNPEALKDTLMSISIVVTGPTCCQHHPMSYVCLENRRISFAVSELFSSVLNEKVYSAMKFQNQLDVTIYLISFIEKSLDYNVTTEALKLLGTVISLNNKFSISFPDDTKEKVVHLLCKKLMDKTESIAICAMLVAGLIMNKDENQFWKDTVLKQNLHQIVWEMGVDGVQDGMLKAASLQATLQACKVPHFWEDIQTSKKVNEGDVMKIFFRYYRDPDFYVQRESLTCIFEWLKHKEGKLSSTYRDHLLIILSEAVKSLDTDQKDIALEAWTWLMESQGFFCKQSVDDLLRAVCESGCASSLILAAEDCDEAIQYKATKILINFRKTLMEMGCTADYIPSENSNSNLSHIKPVQELSVDRISREERDAGIENVLAMTTTEQIAKLAFVPDISSDDNRMECDPVQVESLAVPVDSFLKYVWSSKLDCVISKPDVSTDLFSEHTLSLLDDIIASDAKDIHRPLDDTADCY